MEGSVNSAIKAGKVNSQPVGSTNEGNKILPRSPSMGREHMFERAGEGVGERASSWGSRIHPNQGL